MSDQNIIHSLDSSSEVTINPLSKLLLFIVGALVIGIAGGYFLSNNKAKAIVKKAPAAKMSGIEDKKTFKDKAEGILQEGGIEGEGTYHLQRPGGVSQSVYLTSSTVDLSPYTGKKVRVWGVTYTGEKAGWLMDVGLIELLQ